MTSWGAFAIVVALALLPCGSSAQDSGSLWSRDTLTGDWGGLRSKLANRGLTLDIQVTEFYQGLLSGDGNDDFEFSGRADVMTHLDFGKLGLWDGGGFHTHIESRWGQPRGSRGVAFWPINTGIVLPLGEYVTVVATSIYFSQRFGSSASLMLGKINAVDLLASDPFYGGWGNTRFFNIAFVAPPSGVLPPVIMGGVFSYRVKPLSFTFMVYDPHDQTDKYNVDDLFSDGGNFLLGTTWTGSVFGRPSSVDVTGIYSTKRGANLAEILLPSNLKTGTRGGSYNISLKVSHLLFESPTRPGQGFGFYAKAAVADGNPNPIKAFFSGGFAGHGVVPCRPRDSFGIGYYYYDFSNDLQDALDPVISFDSEQGVEMFYNFAVTPWFKVTADLQWIDPAVSVNDNAWVGALRANLTF
jgi:porin